MREQQGLTLSGLMIWSVLIIVMVLLALKVGPAYMEYYTIQKAFHTIAADPAFRNAPRREIERAFASRAAIDNMQSVTGDDLDLSRDGGNLVISASYSTCVPLFGNARVCLDFHPTSEK